MPKDNIMTSYYKRRWQAVPDGENTKISNLKAYGPHAGAAVIVELLTDLTATRPSNSDVRPRPLNSNIGGESWHDGCVDSFMFKAIVGQSSFAPGQRIVEHNIMEIGLEAGCGRMYVTDDEVFIGK